MAYVRGLQLTGVAATINHYVRNESEHQRMSMSSEIAERALRNLYLLPFERAVKEAGVRQYQPERAVVATQIVPHSKLQWIGTAAPGVNPAAFSARTTLRQTGRWMLRCNSI